MLKHCFLTVIIAICLPVVTSFLIDPDYHKINRAPNRTWEEAIAIAKALVAQMTLEEKCDMTAGIPSPCAGTVTPIPRLNFPGLCLIDSPSGVHTGLFSTAFPPGIHTAAAWDRDLTYKRASAIGKEFRGKGINFALGPIMNMNRNALGGRNWEAFGADPYLAGEQASYDVQGLQDQGVVATLKHYICNEQETNRLYGAKNSINNRLSDTNYMGYSVNIDDKTIHEVYLWPFAAAVAAGAGSIMCSYNQLNGTAACQNNKTLNGILKTELEFQGNVMSDWLATKAGVESALAGLDLEMPGGDGLMGNSLVQAVKSGALTEARVNDMATRILTPYFLLGQDQGYPSFNLDRDSMEDHYKISREVGAAGIILLKNTNNVLPFKAGTDNYFSVYGAPAGQFYVGLNPFGSGSDEGFDGALYQGGGAGFVLPTYGIDPLSALLAKARESHLQIQYVTSQYDYNSIVNSFSARGFGGGKCLVFINSWATEGRDRYNLNAFHDGDRLVLIVAGHCASTIVIVNSVAQLNLDAWIDHPNVAAVIWSGLPGSEYGNALVDVLFGNYNPGGKLVFTIAKNDSDYGTNITETYTSNYTEGVFLDYRHFDQNNITPRFHFGYGLSYTTFSLSQLDILKLGEGKRPPAYRKRPTPSYTATGASKLYEPVYAVSFTVTNTGEVDGSEVPQLYLGFPAEAAEPSKVLRGFERVYLVASESKRVTLTLTQKDISYWNVMKQNWTVASGNYTVWIGTSANNDDLKLQSYFIVQ